MDKMNWHQQAKEKNPFKKLKERRAEKKAKRAEKMAKKTFIPLKSIQLVLLRRTSNSIDFLTLHFCFFYTHFFLGRSLMCHFPPSGLQSPVIEV